MDKKKLEYFRKRLETRQQELRHMVTRNQQDGRSADEEATQDIADRAASSYNIVSRLLWRAKTRSGKSFVPSGGARSPAISSEANR